MIDINASSLSCFPVYPDRSFVFVTNGPLVENVRLVDPDGKYRELGIRNLDDFASLTDLLAELDEYADVLLAAPNTYVKSPSVEALGAQRRLATLACYSTPTGADALQHFIRQAENTDSEGQNRFADHFFEKAQESSYLKFVDEEYGCEANFFHLDETLEWHEQVGELAPGQQQILPSGEISTLAVSVFDENIRPRLKVDGHLVFRGTPVVHSGSVSFLEADQQTIYNELSALSEHPLILEVCNGVIVGIEDVTGRAGHCKDMLEAMMKVDSRYRVLLELGFGINRELRTFPGNNAMNEVFGGKNGVMHFGLGLLPFTQYHMDFLCPHTLVKNEQGQVIFGGMPGFIE